MDWRGIIPPQYIEAQKRFRKVVLNPPNFEPGSWIGAGRVFYDSFYEEYLLSVRPRKAPPTRAYEVRVYSSSNGESFYLKSRITKEEIAEHLGEEIKSVEGVVILRDPFTSELYLYVSVNNGKGWETVLYTSDDPTGPWKPMGYVLRLGDDYDAREARDPVIDIVDGTYFMIYKANNGKGVVNSALAVSSDGIHWKKLGVPTIDGEKQPKYYQLTGTILSGARGPIIVGLARRYVVNGCGLARHLEAYVIDYRNLNLETIAKLEWTPRSPYERKDYPTHGYSSITYDFDNQRLLIYVEALDPVFTKEPGWRTQVDRWILYGVPFP